MTNPYTFTDNPMVSGVSVCNTDIVNDNIMCLKWMHDQIATDLNGKLDIAGGTMTGNLVNDAIFKKNGTFPTSTPSSNTYLVGYEIRDNNNNRIGLLGSAYHTNDDTYTYLQHERVVNGTTKYASMQLGIAADGFPCFNFPMCTTKATTTSSASSKRVAVLTQNYVNGTSWYRVWSDGWIEQGGAAQIDSDGQTVALLRTMSNANYFVGANCTISARFASCHTKTTSNFKVYTGDDNSFNSSPIVWYACGY